MNLGEMFGGKKKVEEKGEADNVIRPAQFAAIDPKTGLLNTFKSKKEEMDFNAEQGNRDVAA